VVEPGGPTMFARIGVVRALNRGHVREFIPTQEEPHWDRRKLGGTNENGVQSATSTISRSSYRRDTPVGVP
jgi:hypothetical protein